MKTKFGSLSKDLNIRLCVSSMLIFHIFFFGSELFLEITIYKTLKNYEKIRNILIITVKIVM